MTDKKNLGYIIMVGMAVLLLFGSCNGDNERILPEERTITESVYSSVTIQPDSLYQANAVVSGLLEKNLVSEGQQVTKGTPILQITNNTPRLNAENAALNLRLAQENYRGDNAVLNSLQDEIASARLTLANDSINYFRQKKLWEQQIGSAVEFDNRKLAYELSSKKLALLINQYERSKTELATKLAQAENNYKSATINSRDFTLHSEINGTVYALYKEPGEIVTSMEPLATIGSSNLFLIEMLVDEVDIVKLRLGQRALVTLDAYGNKVFEAEIIKIYPKKDERSQTFKVEGVFKEAPAPLYPGLAGEGNILVAEKKAALTIPKSYLVDGNKVRTKDGLKVVQLGLQNFDYVEVVSGIDSGSYILKPEE